MSEKYSLVGVDGNAFSVMGYVSNALRREHLGGKVKEYTDKAMGGDYNSLLVISMEYLEMANKAAAES